MFLLSYLGIARGTLHQIFSYREAVHVPLIVRLPGGARGGTRVAGPVAQVDMGDCLARLGRTAEAEREFLAELRELPRSREARIGLAMP